jgi:hypothetical protein
MSCPVVSSRGRGIYCRHGHRHPEIACYSDISLSAGPVMVTKTYLFLCKLRRTKVEPYWHRHHHSLMHSKNEHLSALYSRHCCQALKRLCATFAEVLEGNTSTSKYLCLDRWLCERVRPSTPRATGQDSVSMLSKSGRTRRRRRRRWVDCQGP